MSFRKLLATMMVVSMVFGLVGTAFAQESNVNDAFCDETASVLKQYGVFRGDPSGNMLWGKALSRAEAATLTSRLLGKEQDAALLQGAAAFPDTSNHWASGYIALAKNAGAFQGFPDGTFKPDATLTYAQTVTFLARLAGVQPTSAEWPFNYLNAAVAAGLVSESSVAYKLPNNPAIRCDVAALTAAAAVDYKMANGLSLMQAAYDSTAPDLKLDAVESVTKNASVAVSGSAGDAVAAYVNGEAVALADGSFSATVDLAIGANTIMVTALDLLGNEASESVAISRVNTDIASIEAPASITVTAGGSADVAVVVKDTNGAVVDTEVAGTSEIGTYADGTFTAGTKAGTGTLTLTAGDKTASVAVTVEAGALASLSITPSASSVAPGELVTFTVAAADANGNAVAASPTFTADGSGALINSSTGNFIASKAGSYTVTATAGDISATAKVGVYGDVAEFVIEGPAELVGNDETLAVFTVKAVDANGNLVANADNIVDITVSDASATLGDEDGDALTDSGDDSGVVVDVTLEDGVAKFSVKADDSLWGVIIEVSAEDADDADIDEGSANLEIIEQVATSLKVTADTYLPVNDGGENAKSKVKVLDQEGEDMLTGAWDVDWEITGPAEEDGSGDTDGTDVTGNAGTGQFELTLASLQGDTGDVTVTFTVADVGTASGTLKAVVAQDAAKVMVEVDDEDVVADDTAAAAGSASEVTLTVTDKNGVPVKWTGTLVVSFGSDSDLDFTDNSTFSGTGDNGSSVYKVEVDFTAESEVAVLLGTTEAGSHAFTVTDAADDLTSANGSMTVAAAAGNYVKLTRTDRFVLDSTASTEFTVKAQVYDEFGNKKAKSGVEVTLTGYDDADTAYADVTTTTDELTVNGDKTSDKVDTDANGVATFTVSTRPYTSRDYTVKISAVSGVANIGSPANDGASSVAKIALVTNVPKKVTIAIKDDAGVDDISSITAGGETTWIVKVFDAFDTKLEGYDDLLEIEVADDEWDADGNSATDGDRDSDAFGLAVNGSQYEETGFAAKAGRISVKAILDLGTGISLEATDSVRVNAGAVANVTVVEADDESITVEEDAVKAITLKLADAWGNVVSGTKNYYVAFDTTETDVFVRTSTTGANLTQTNPLARAATAAASHVTLRTSKVVYVLVTGSADDNKLNISLIDYGANGVRNDGGDDTLVADPPYELDIDVD